MGDPGWPELAACTASMHSVRIVLIASLSMADFSFATITGIPCINQCPGTLDVFHQMNRAPRRTDHLDVIGKNRGLSRFHYQVLSDLLDVIGSRFAAQHQTLGLGSQMELTDSAVQPAIYLALQSPG